MPSTLLSSGTVLVDEHLRTQAQAVAEEAHDRSIVELLVRLEDGAEVALPPELARFFNHVLQGLTRGPVSVTTLPDELTTTTAADILGVSRPTVMKWTRAGRLPSHKVGSHTRLQATDVLRLRRELMEERVASFQELRAWEDALESVVGPAK